MSQAEQIATFCSALIGGHGGQGDDRLSGQMISVWTLPDKRTRWCRADDPGAVASLLSETVEQQPGIHAVYVGMGSLPADVIHAKQAEDPKRAPYFRAKKSDVTGVVALWADIDVGTFGHEGGPYPPDVESARRVLDSVGLPPTILINSGYGLQAWWVLSEPWLAADYGNQDAARLDMYNLSRDWISTLRYRADMIGGWKIDSVFDLSRLMRAPGSWNQKDSRNPKPVKIIEHNPNAVYDLDQFRERLAPTRVLNAYSLRAEGSTGLTAEQLPGVHLSEVWARVNSEAYRANGYTPPWLEDVLEWGTDADLLNRTWNGNRPDLFNDASSYDASLARQLNDLKVDLERQVEAIMCRRLRSGEKPEKVDPHIRQDYLLRTIAFTQASAREVEQRKDKAQEFLGRAAAGTTKTTEPPPPAPKPPETPAEDHDTYADYVDELLTYSVEHDSFPDDPVNEPEWEPNPEPEVAEEEPPAPAAPAPPSPPPPPARKASLGPAPEHDPWGARGPDTVEIMNELTKLLIPDVYRKRGIVVWTIEHRDYGEAQRGRVLFKIPEDYAWPDGHPPALYRAGRPLASEWYKRDSFDTPKGYRLALEHDALIPAEPVGNKKGDWSVLITNLVPYWRRDSSASDLASSTIEWLHEFLVSTAPTLDEAEAADRKRSLLVDHKQWGEQGVPVIYLSLQSFLDYVGTRPGGITGRNSKTLQSYLDLTPRRPRLLGADGKVKRSQWLEIGAGQFSDDEWLEILTAAREARDSRERRRLRLIKGEAS